METRILGIVIVLFLIAGCTKPALVLTSRDSFVGTYSMHDTIASYTYNGSTYTRDTQRYTYTMNVVAMPGSTDKLVFSNIGNCSGCLDTASVLSTIASFINVNANAGTATLTGNVITLEGGGTYNSSGGFGGRLGKGVGTKN